MNSSAALAAKTVALALLLMVYAAWEANATTPSAISVNGNTSGTYTLAGTGSLPMTADINGFGVLHCTSASAAGEVKAGNPISINWATLTSVMATCPSIIPGLSFRMAVSCGGIQVNGSDGTEVTSALTDVIYSVVHFGSHPLGTACIDITFMACDFSLAGTVLSAFDEGSQQFMISGTLTIGGATGWACGLSGAISNGNTVVISVPLHVTNSSSGPINFLP